MTLRFYLLLAYLTLSTTHSIFSATIAEEFQTTGYIELYDPNHGSITYDHLYESFERYISFLKEHPEWDQKLYAAKERFIRSKGQQYYATHFFGLYDESHIPARNQIAFYYATHFHTFLYTYYKECETIKEIDSFLKLCQTIQQSYIEVFQEAATSLQISTLFDSSDGIPPILFKVVKYTPSYKPQKPHYDGTIFSLFLDSTDHQSLLLSPYKTPSYKADDFFCPLRTYERKPFENSILLIPGCLVTDFSIYPTPHIVQYSGKTRYATIAFAMRPHYMQQKINLSPIPSFNH